MGMDTTRLVELLRRVPVFMRLSDSQLRTVANGMKEVRVNKGAALFVEGERGDTMALVVEGALEIRKSPVVGADVAIGTVYEAEVVGEMACIDPAPRSATVAGKQDSVVFLLSREAFQEVTSREPRAASAVLMGILRQLAVRLRDANGRIDVALDQLGHRPGGTVDVPLPSPIGQPTPVPRPERLVGFEDFAAHELDAIYRVAPPMHYPAGTMLCEQGDLADACWILAEGMITVHRQVGREVRFLAAIPPGAVLGQMSLIDGGQRSARLLVKHDSVILTLDADRFHAMTEAATPFALSFLEKLAIGGIRRLRSTMVALATLLAADPTRLSAIEARPRAEVLPDESSPELEPPEWSDDELADRLQTVRANSDAWWMDIGLPGGDRT